MLFNIFLLFISFGAVFAVEDVELLADDVKREGDVITANRNVLVYSRDYLVQIRLLMISKMEYWNFLVT